uniref:Uncharacterized protein n=1 Tax=Arundo donax TaxID=35708 RepID=A0A0A9H5L7_ARUDO
MQTAAWLLSSHRAQRIAPPRCPASILSMVQPPRRFAALPDAYQRHPPSAATASLCRGRLASADPPRISCLP